MQTLIADAASASGASEDQVRKALGILAGFLQETLEARTWKKVAAAVPDLGELAGPPRKQKGFLSGMLGGNAALLALPGKFAKIGLSKGQVKSFLPMVLEWLEGHVEPELWREARGQLPAPLRG